MPVYYIACLQKYLVRYISLIVLLCLFSLACQQQTVSVEPDVSKAVKDALDHADSMSVQGQAKESLTYLDSAYLQIRNPNIAEQYKRYQYKSNHYLLLELNYRKANIYADSMLGILNDKEQKYKLEYTEALFAKGDILFEKKGYAMAFKYYYDASQFAFENLDRCERSRFSYRLGLIRYKQKQYKKAIPYIKQALLWSSYCKKSNDLFVTRQSAMNTIALCFENTDRLDSALYYYQKALNFIGKREPGDPGKRDFAQMAMGVVYGNMGGVYAKMNHFQKAERYLKESIKINDRPNFDPLDAQTAKIKLVDLYIRFTNLEKASRLLEELRLAGELSTDRQLELYRLQWRYFDGLHQQPKANLYMWKYYNFRDSIYKVRKSLRTADMDIAFKVNEQRYKLILSSKKSQIKNSYLIAFIFFFVLSTGVLTGVLRNRKKLMLLNEKITLQNSDMHKALTALEQSQVENSRIMKIVAHDLRTPIAATISVTEILKTANLPAKYQEMIEELALSSQHSLEMITNLINVNTTVVLPVKEPVEMHRLISCCAKLLQFKADEKQLRLELNLQEAFILVSGEKIWRVMSNIIVNAIKFSQPGAKIEIGLEKTCDSVLISVKDYGIGIPPELKDEVFNMFTEARRAGTSGEPSFGLGMAISKQIVEAHGGKIWVESEVGQGSVFFVKLPLNF